MYKKENMHFKIDKGKDYIHIETSGKSGLYASIDNKGVVEFAVKATGDSPLRGSEMFQKNGRLFWE